MLRPRALRRLVVTIATSVLVAAACSGAGDDPTEAAQLSSRSTGVTDEPPPGLADAAPPGDDDGAGEADAAAELDEAEIEPAGPVAPLTGLPVPDGPDGEAILTRPALVIKIDNHPQARPQTGLELADIVFDMRAEGVTRFAAVFHSSVPDPVGPVRSSRTSDFDLLTGFDTPLYASSGGNNYVAAGLRRLPIVSVTNLTRNEYFRDRTRAAPHNLYVDASDLFALAPADAEPPEPWFRYRRADDQLPASAEPVDGVVSVDFTGSPVVTHRWDATVGGWARAQDGAPHTTRDGDQLAPENVVIMVTDYTTSAADPASPELRSTGDGPLFVLTDGHVVTGTWERPEPEGKPTLVDEEGEPILLTPGRTWVLYPQPGQVDVGGG